MSADDWLGKLSHTTEYRELQAVFAAIAADARAASDGEQLVTAIDEAIRRIEHERQRDEDELDAFEKEYASFKEQQTGVVGWFKRHLPFTETRRQEIGHRDVVGDQRAEILADNLVIARAQMLKEQLLPPRQRRLGFTAAEWRRRFDQHHSISHLSHLADEVRELTAELVQSKLFAQQLHTDIEAFGTAKFSDEEDQQRRKADLAAARNEKVTIDAEITDEESIRTDILGQLGQLVKDELSGHDAAFHELHERVQNLERACEASRELKSDAKEFQDELIRFHELCQEYDALPKEFEELEREQDRLQSDMQRAERDQAAADNELSRYAPEYEAAVDKAKQAQSAYEAAKQLYDAYLQEQTNKADVDASSFNTESPVESQYRELETAVSQAEDELRNASGPYDSAKERAGAATGKTDALRRHIEEAQAKVGEFRDSEERLRKDLHSVSERTHSVLERTRRCFSRYLETLWPLSWETSLPSLDGLALPRFNKQMRIHHDRDNHGQRRETREVHEGLASTERLVTALQQETKDLKRELEASKENYESAWRTRCRELLGESLAKEVCEK